MKKTKIIVSSILMLISAVMLTMGIISVMTPNLMTSMTVSVEDGVALPSEYEDQFILTRDGKYVITINCHSGEDDYPGFVTGAKVTNEDNETIYVVTGNEMRADSVELELPKGTYNVTYTFLTSDEQFNEYAEENELEYFSGSRFVDYRDGSWTLNMFCDISANIKVFMVIIFAIIILVVSFYSLVVAIVSRKDNKNHYDERQIIGRGEAFKAGFYTGIAYQFGLYLINLFGIGLPLSFGNLAIIGLALSLGVFATIAIWKDAYVAVNENKKTTLISLGLAAVANAIPAIRFLTESEDNGFLIANDILFVLLTWIFMVIVAKSICDKIADKEDGGED